jgi:large subunit ribosomal protein L24
VNRVKKHTRIRTTQRGAKTGGIVTQEASDPRLNDPMVVDPDGQPDTGSATAVDENGHKGPRRPTTW